jgi:hypothetical protein
MNKNSNNSPAVKSGVIRVMDTFTTDINKDFLLPLFGNKSFA